MSNVKTIASLLNERNHSPEFCAAYKHGRMHMYDNAVEINVLGVMIAIQSYDDGMWKIEYKLREGRRNATPKTDFDAASKKFFELIDRLDSDIHKDPTGMAMKYFEYLDSKLSGTFVDEYINEELNSCASLIGAFETINDWKKIYSPYIVNQIYEAL